MAEYSGGEQIEQAQAVLERHAVSSVDGLCVACGVLGPCASQQRAARVFARALRLPRRVPGLTQPHLIGARRAAGPGWFGSAG
jgi:hypothetical protein